MKKATVRSLKRDKELVNVVDKPGKKTGRPREHDREQIAIDIITWARLSDSININKFCAYYEPIIPHAKMCSWAREDPLFRQAFDCAKMFLAFRREEKLNRNELHVKAYDLNAPVYDLFLRDEKREQLEFESALRKQEDLIKPQNLIVRVAHDGLGSGIDVQAEKLPNTANNGVK